MGQSNADSKVRLIHGILDKSAEPIIEPYNPAAAASATYLDTKCEFHDMFSQGICCYHN